MTTRGTNFPLVAEPESRTCADRQVKASKGQSILAVGLQRFRTLSGVSQKRPQHQRPPLPVIGPVTSSDRNLLSLAPVSSSERKPEPAASSTKLSNNSFLIDANDSGPFSPCVSHLQGIHFVRDANQDPDLDAESTTSWSQSTQSEKSPESPPPEIAINRLSCHSRSFSVTWSEQCVSPSPISVTPSEDSSSLSDSSLTSRMLEKIPQKLLSVRACHLASPPIDCESPYAPYAPTSPLSATNMPDPQVPGPAHNTSTIPFNIRSALRNTLPSKTPKAAMKNGMPQQRQTTQDPQVSYEINGLESYPHSSDMVCSPKTLLATNPIPVLTLGREGVLDPCTSPSSGLLPSSSGSSGLKTGKSEFITKQLGWSDDHQHRHSPSPGALSSIPFPGSFHDEEAPESRRERTRSQSSISHFRNHLNNFWSQPINRLRTSSSLSTVIRGIKPGKRRAPSDASFEARPCSMNTESSYEILDSSAIPFIK